MSCETRIQAMHINGVRFFGSNLLYTSSHSVTDTLYCGIKFVTLVD